MNMFEKRRFFHGPHSEGHYDSDYHHTGFGKGDMKYIILDLIKDKPRYGYEIIRELEERSFGFYKPSPGAVYPTLQMLEELGYVTLDEQDGKKVYSITGEGIKFLDERKGVADEIRDQMRRHWNPKNIKDVAEIMFEVGKLRKDIKHHFRRMDPEKMARIREVITRACQEVSAILQEESGDMGKR
jgi:DNA-binding PadR family transcriptional regulator